ncbi:hypothetical protein UP09_22515 [Bradyrhizobium sp. LTSP885]|nr:hypothetical protein UP09_22515 [Bradyrhizobium sp. LTSP885]
MKHEIVAWANPYRQRWPAECLAQIAVIGFQTDRADMSPEAITEDRHGNRPKRLDDVVVQSLARIDDIACRPDRLY